MPLMTTRGADAMKAVTIIRTLMSATFSARLWSWGGAAVFLVGVAWIAMRWAGKTVKKDLDPNNTPTLFNFKGTELMAASGKECRVYLIDPLNAGGADHHLAALVVVGRARVGERARGVRREHLDRRDGATRGALGGEERVEAERPREHHAGGRADAEHEPDDGGPCDGLARYDAAGGELDAAAAEQHEAEREAHHHVVPRQRQRLEQARRVERDEVDRARGDPALAEDAAGHPVDVDAVHRVTQVVRA